MNDSPSGGGPRGQGPLPPAYFWLAVLLMIALHWIPPAIQLIQAPVRFAGLPLILAGALINIQLSRLYEREKTTIKPFQEPSRLILGGHYRYSRNPMYLWMLAVLAGLFILLGSLKPLLIPPLFAWIVTERFIVPEEASLAARFGEDYLQYQRRVRRWL